MQAGNAVSLLIFKGLLWNIVEIVISFPHPQVSVDLAQGLSRLRGHISGAVEQS